jgi:UDP-glucose 4-epimerase
LIPLLMQAALGRRGPLGVFGTDNPTPDRTAMRECVYVVDLADAHGKTVAYLGGGGETTVLNLGAGVGVALDTPRRVRRLRLAADLEIAVNSE